MQVADGEAAHLSAFAYAPLQFQSRGYNFGFVDFENHAAALQAKDSLNGLKLADVVSRLVTAYLIRLLKLLSGNQGKLGTSIEQLYRERGHLQPLQHFRWRHLE